MKKALRHDALASHLLKKFLKARIILAVGNPVTRVFQE